MGKEQRTRFLSKQDFLYPRGVAPDHLKRLYERSSHALRVWVGEATSFRRDPREILRAWAEDKTSGSIFKHAVEGLEFVGAMDVADRSSNGLRVALLCDNRDRSKTGEFGTFLFDAYNDPEFSDHNHEHSRRFERWLEAFLLNIGKLRHSDSVIDWIDSALLTAYFHDIDQLLTLERNVKEERGKEGKEPELPAKKGHALAAAVMLLALHERYAEEAVLRKREAWDIMAGAAYMVLKHDEPEKLSYALQGRELPTTLLYGDDLWEKFDTNQLDLTKITPSQLIELLKMVKKKHGFCGTDSVFGLHPLFEKEYLQELERLDKNDRPLFERPLDEDQRKSLEYMTELTVRSDMMEMIAPPVEAIMRTFNTQYSPKRAFFRPEEFEKSLGLIAEGPGNVEPEVDSDTRRILWEFLHIDKMSDGSDTAKSRYIRKALKTNAVMGILAFASIGEHIMKGDASAIHTHYEKRIIEVSKKALAKAGYSVLDQARIAAQVTKRGISAVGEALEKKGASSLAKRYSGKIHFLYAEMESIVEGLKKGSDALPVYSDDEVQQFRKLCDVVLANLCGKHGVSQRELARLRKKVRKGNYSATTPYGRYDSIASPEHIRTLIEPLQ